MYDYVVVGAGLFGATFANVAHSKGYRVLVIDKRNHIGGNCYTHVKEGIIVHEYGPHIFHTSDERVWQYVNKFATFDQFMLRVKAVSNDNVYSMPINMMTMHQLWGVRTIEDAKEMIKKTCVPCDNPANCESWLLAHVGKDVYETFFKGYTSKQWGKDPSELPASIIKRIPIRLTWDDNYYNDPFQGIPRGGYTPIFEKMLDGINVLTDIDYFDDAKLLKRISRHTVYTGTIDEYYKGMFAPLEYRSLDFMHNMLNSEDHQGTPMMNYVSSDVPYTRIVEHKHFDRTCPQKEKTIITFEHPKEHDGGIPFYPVNNERNMALFDKYTTIAKLESRTSFGGRLGSYAYLDMDKTIMAAWNLLHELGIINYYSNI